EDARIVSTTEYATTAFQHLPHITVHNPEYMLTEVIQYYEFLAHLPDEIISNYTLTWIDPTCIKLTPHHTPHVEFYAWHMTTFSPDMLRAMKYIPTILRHPPHNRKSPAHGIWHIDVRVPKYLIVSYAAKERP